MSLSQKHAGLILVPWFNSDEWRYVYHSVYSKDIDKRLEALELLHIWKLRTPILSSGVEGTLILLEALLLNTDSMSEEQISNLYAIALMRFLNLSAANNEKQGSFTRTSAKNELPKWLINLRHDIAHGHQIPSLYNLKMGLDYGFGWLKERYWQPQSRIIKDYYIGEDANADTPLSQSLRAYTEINIALFEDQDFDGEYMEKVKRTIYKRFRRTVDHPYLMLDILLEMITQSLEKDQQREQICLDGLVSANALLKPYYDILNESDPEGNVKLNKNFRNIWQNLLNLFHQYGLLLILVDKLFDVVGDISYSDDLKKVASLWISELFMSLQSLQEKEGEEDTLTLVANEFNYKKESISFQKRILHCPNNYSFSFMNSILKYNSNNNQFDEDALTLARAAEPTGDIHQDSGKVYTLEDLKLQNLNLDGVLINDCSGNENSLSTDTNDNFRIVAGRKWAKIKDTSIFKNCPLGILPHQFGKSPQTLKHLKLV